LANNNDWAIVVGITSYFDPDLAGLHGAENDAQEFYDWVIASDGGAVPEGQRILILSKTFDPPFAHRDFAMPTVLAVKEAFDHLLAVAGENETKGLGRVVGRRLYLFLAGHGFAPNHRIDQTALLTAEASIADAQLTHILGPYMADHFRRARFFEEILLFMDCCRELMECAQLYEPYEIETASGFDKVRRLYAYGARVAKDSREWQMADGVVHGVFTRTLVEALKSTGYDPSDPSKITAESLKNQLYNGFKTFTSPADLRRPDPPEPEVVYESKPGANFTIVSRASLFQRITGTTPVPKFSVTIKVASPIPAGKATIRDKDLKIVSEEPLAPTITMPLERGFYSVEVGGDGRRVPFEVTGEGTVVDV